jgi:hypothetical protein
MSAKNRAFALAIGTAALVALSAPMASAASFAGPGGHGHAGSNSSSNSVPNGFNNDSVFNVSGNQLNSQTCGISAQSATGTVIQPAISALTTATSTVGLGTGDVTPGNTATCAQGPSSTTAPSTGGSAGGQNSGGFSNDSVVKLSNNELQNQICTITGQTSTATALQAVLGLAAPITSTVTTGTLNPTNSATCSQDTASDNS